MIKPLLISAAFVGLAVSTADAQVQSYRHRSTILGDHRAGLAELRLAQGLTAMHTAQAQSTLLQNQLLRSQLEKNYWDSVQARKELRTQNVAQNRAEIMARRVAMEERTAGKARELFLDVKDGTYRWAPALLEAPARKYTAAVHMILQKASPTDGIDSLDRRQLSFAAAQLKRMIQTNRIGANQYEQGRALRVIKLIESLAATDRDPIRLANR